MVGTSGPRLCLRPAAGPPAGRPTPRDLHGRICKVGSGAVSASEGLSQEAQASVWGFGSQRCGFFLPSPHRFY